MTCCPRVKAMNLTLSFGGSGGSIRSGDSGRGRKFGQVLVPRTSRNSPGATGWFRQTRGRRRFIPIRNEGPRRIWQAYAQKKHVRLFGTLAF